MKKTTKKLISIVLSLMMVLSLIPMGTMTAMAYNDNDHCQCGHPFVNHPQGFPTMCVRCPDGNCTSGGFTPESETCDKCLTCGHDASVHESSACYDCGIRDACFEYGSAKREFCVLDAGHTGACSATLPKTYDGTDNWGIYYKSSFTVESPKLCQSSSFALGDIFNNVQNRAPSATVYCDGVVVAKASNVTGKVVKIDGDKLYICSDHTGELGTLCEICTVDTTPEWVATIISNVDAVSEDLYSEAWGATLKGYFGMIDFDSLDSLVSDMDAPEYSQEGSVYTIEGVTSYGKFTVTITLDADENIASVALNYADAYTATFTPAPTTPEWFDTIASKVDACSDKLVNEKGETYAEKGGITGAIAQLTNPVYTNEGSVYTIRGYLGASTTNEGELVITLDSNGDVASLAVNAYVIGTKVNSIIYTPVPPHTCTLAKKNGQAATCTKDGWKAYYQCKDKSCGKIYATNKATGTAYDTLTAWKASKAGKIAKTGHSYTSAVTKKATYSAEGVRTYTCSNCGDKYTKAIAKLELTTDAKYNNSTKMNAGFEVSSSSKNVTVNWGKVAGADGYMIYANYCGKDTKPVLIKTIKGEATKTYSFSKIDGKNINFTKNMKVYVVAYSTIDGKKVQLAKTIVGHVVGGKSKKYTNSTKIAVKNSTVTLSKGKTSKIKATVTYKDAKKKPVSNSHAAEKRYRSSNKAVATVDKNGKITAVAKGKCTIYVFAKNGVSAKVTVTVK